MAQTSLVYIENDLFGLFWRVLLVEESPKQ